MLWSQEDLQVGKQTFERENVAMERCVREIWKAAKETMEGQSRMASNWGKYSSVKVQYFKERTPQKLWLELLGKSYLGFIYWTTLVEFLRNLFWFQLKAGGLAPQLGFLVYLFIPSVAVGRPAFRQFLDTHPWSRALLVVGGVLGLWGEFQRSVIRRLTLSACGVGLLGIYVWEGMWAATTARRERTAFGMVGGILLLQALRWAFAGPNPVVSRWWGLVFLGFIPGFFSALLVLCEDLAESEGEVLQSFIEDDEDVELEPVESVPGDNDGWRCKRTEVSNSTSFAANSDNRNHNGYSETQTIDTTVSVTALPELQTRTDAEVSNGDGEGLDDRLLEEPAQVGNGDATGKQKMDEGSVVVEDWRLVEMMETETPKTGMSDTFQSWSWGFGGEAFRQARTDIMERELEVADLPVQMLSPGFDEMIQEGSSPMKKLLQKQVLKRISSGVYLTSLKATSSLKFTDSPMRNKRWGEGEEVPWLKDVKGDHDLSDSELDVYRHKDTKWSTGSCMRTMQMGIGSGSLLFLTHWILTAPTSFSRWLGLRSELGWVSIFSLLAGLVAATEYPRILCLRRTQGLVFWVFAAVGACLLMWSSSGTMVGSAMLAFSVPSLWISIAQCNLENYPGGGLGIMVLVYVIFVFWSTSLVAYQSIPALGFVRGTRAALMGCAVTGIGIGVGREPGGAAKERAAHGGIWRGLFAAEVDSRGRQTVGALIVLVGIIWVVAFGVRPHPLSAISQGGPVKVLNFNVQQGFSRAGTANFDAVLAMLQNEQPHFAMLQETDMMHIAHGNLDMIDYWATHLRMHSLYTPPSKSDTWGCSILSAFPFIYSESGVLSSPKGENACYQYAQVVVAGEVIHLVNTHFGTLEKEIELQAEQLAEKVRHILNPLRNEDVWLLMGGDLNAAPLSVGYNLTISSGVGDAFVSQNGNWKNPADRDPGAGYVFYSFAFNCTSWAEPPYDQQKTADGYPIVATFDFL